MNSIPVISLHDYRTKGLSGVDCDALAHACKDHGFFIVGQHGGERAVDNALKQAREFFALPKAQKKEVQRGEKNPLGYFDRELTKRRRDQKEVFDFKTSGKLSADPMRLTPWPNSLPGFKPALTEFFSTFEGLAEEIMRLMLVSLGFSVEASRVISEDSFGELHTSAARLNFYPIDDPLSEDEVKSVTPLGDMALHHHTDPGAITLLIQDDAGGLQAFSNSLGWVDVPPSENSIVVNVGDVMQVWTNDECVAGVHRVVPVERDKGRYSLPFFYQPRIDSVVEPWRMKDKKALYTSFTWRDYITGRVTDNFADYGVDDIQISKYRINS